MQQIDWAQVDPAEAIGDSCLWSIERYSRQYASPIKNVRAVVHGHMTVRYVKQLGNVFFVDTGGWKADGCFSFLNLETLQAESGPRNAPAAGRKNL